MLQFNYHDRKGKMNMINMVSKVKDEFPELYTKQGVLKKREPKKYKCDCGYEFSKTKNTSVMGMTFGSPICEKCRNRGKENITYNIWMRMKNTQIEQEDFILNTVKEYGTIRMEELEDLLFNTFSERTNAIGTLVYFDYLTVDAIKKEKWNMIEYSINTKKVLDERYELIR